MRKKKKSWRCPNCGKGIRSCKDVHGVGQAFACERKKRS